MILRRARFTSADSILIPAAEVAQCGADPDTQAIVDKAEADSREAGKRVVATGYTTPFMRGVFTTPDGLTGAGLEPRYRVLPR